MKPIRCAIYTRKSSEEGLEQGFNSLDAQREACAAYILSQASEGWTQVAERYDDGGLSGGTLERPALQRLLAGIAANRIDIVVVYKVDRLTRSLLDFSRLVEAFDAAGASFVSVTQSFNTTTSMGRLTLNMLLSFAQFEREVTAERIRDKIAASKAKGMWMGGTPPLGYQPDGRSLAIVEEHASIVRHIFERYLALGNVRLLAAELLQQRIHAPRRSSNGGSPIGGVPFTRGTLYLILKRVTYAGLIPHGDKVYPGQHPAIIDQETFDRVQALLATHINGERGARATRPSLLAGKVVDGDGAPLLAVHATKGTARYRYYVSRALHHKESDSGMRVPARELETLVAERVAALFDDHVELIATAWLDVPAHRYAELHACCEELAARQRRRDPAALSIVQQVRIGSAGIEITCDTDGMALMLQMPRQEDGPAIVVLTDTARLTRSGHSMRLVQGDGSVSGAAADRSLLKQLLTARRWWAELRRGEITVGELAQREGVSGSYLTRIVRLALLSPGVVEAILAGRQRSGVDVMRLTLGEPVPASWAAQKALLLPAAAARG